MNLIEGETSDPHKISNLSKLLDEGETATGRYAVAPESTEQDRQQLEDWCAEREENVRAVHLSGQDESGSLASLVERHHVISGNTVGLAIWWN
ncbi:hypothetical protein [Nocardiopsis suaedae]|uniref:Uncharacterized protein n=1 Tax=Nocardiopsis suaedae TaxID=3018444 RepID=A0ABT4TLZ8_9ACTN|nr:hypothetical protein [Nocardiopsis suaedae]MDA2805718.1 hypothetical protein [Nocardiopsis suaedae]